MVERYRRRKGQPKLLGNHQKCWLWGRNVVTETLHAARWPVLELHVSDELLAEELAFVEQWSQSNDAALNIEPNERLTSLCHSREHQGFLAKMAEFPYDRVEDALAAANSPQLFAILDGLQDPHNFGAVIRSAHMLGVDALFVPTRGQVEVTAQVARSSAGAVNHIRIAQADDLVTLAAQLRSRGLRVIGTSQNAERPVFECDLSSGIAVVIGNEGSGIRSEVLAACDELVTIPQFGAVESLNAAVSAGILFYETQRQRHTIRPTVVNRQP
ncbi:MAG: RNA methyltransferase [Planctomycetaceae bacterium]|nr:RNA methyltransferase [Planctomycetaceae bacterium]